MDSRRAARNEFRLAAPFLLTAVATVVLLTAGCGRAAQAGHRTWHAKFGWKAEEYFTHPQVIALCRAIEADDLKEMDRLIAAGVNVNAQGKGKMTPLLWAFPDNKPHAQSPIGGGG